MSVLTGSTGMGKGSSLATGTGRWTWMLAVLRTGAIVSALLCVVIPLAWGKFTYPLFLADYLRIREAGLWGYDFSWDDHWAFTLFASMIASITLGVVGILLAIWGGVAAGNTRGQPAEGASPPSGAWRWALVGAVACLGASVVAYLILYALVAALALLVAGVALVIWAFARAGRAGRGWSALLIAFSILAFFAGALLDGLNLLGYAFTGL